MQSSISKKTKISIVVPVYNGEKTISKLCQGIESALTSFNFEIILVHDQGTDNSWEVIKNLKSKFEQIIGVNLSKNFGQDCAILAGLTYAKGEYVVIMDDDLQHDPKDIIPLYNKIIEGDDICYANFTTRKHSLWKVIGSWVNSKCAQLFYNKAKDIYLSPFKIMTSDLANKIVQHSGPFPYIDGIIFSITHHVSQIEVAHNDRYAGKSNYNLKKSLNIWLTNITGYSVLPLRILTKIGFIISIVGGMLGVFYIYKYFTNFRTVEGWTTLVCLNLFLGGVIIFALGMIGEYIGRTYLALNNRPQFSVKEIVK